MDYIGNVEYQIYRYFDWDVTFEPAELKYIYRIHNPEGFATNATTTNGPIYSYYRKDHLGNNREVWRASYTWGSTTHPAATVQRTQYYPSGLPWKSNNGDNPGSQPYKYGGKEFVEMHGLDEYDSDARWYYPAIMRTTTMDPLAEKYYDISPYAWCANNPVRFVDPDGRRIYMVTGNKVVLASAKIMHQTDIGKTLWNKYNNSRTDDIYISSQKFKNVKAGGYTYANAQKYNIIKNGKITLDLNNPNQSDMSNINGLDVSKSEGKNIHIVNINEKTASTDGTYGDKKFDSGAYAMFHEIDAHIDKDGTYNSELGHKLHGYSLITTEIEGKKVQAIKIEKNSDAWKMIMQLIELNNKENE
ncbi:hypothetical protein SDC9_67351 [bioreactor metagenome]|uniref:RHS repeat-associated core domain-containing protein n=1 Tax=bioreactor metagenome TaxID=1076179 RepID=A0A644Y322_9ZZZZ